MSRSQGVRASHVLIVLILLAATSPVFAQSVSLPIYESFNNMILYNDLHNPSATPMVGTVGWSHLTTPGGRMRPRSDFSYRANSAMIASMDNPGGGGVNEIGVSFDASMLDVNTDRLLLSFVWYDHGDEGDAQDKVHIRGSDVDPWLEVYDFAANSNNGSWTRLRDIDLSAILLAGSQNFSTSTRIRFQQTDNFPVNTDGISIDDVAIELDTEASSSPEPIKLTASMINHTNKAVASGEQIEYKVTLKNPSDGSGDALNSVFVLENFAPGTELVPGSVFTSKGAVLSGNGMSDQIVYVNLGTIADGSTEAVYFSVTVTGEPGDEFANQGTAFAQGISQFLTDDNRNPTSNTDPAIASIAFDNEFAGSASLPVHESFNNADSQTYTDVGPTPLSGLDGWYFSTSDSPAGRLTLRDDFQVRTGAAKVASMDNPLGNSVNELILQFDGNALDKFQPLYLSFKWYDHGDEGDALDAVYVRGRNVDPWVEIYSFADNSNFASWTSVRGIDIAEALRLAGQVISDTVQVKFQQTDNTAINTDGISIEDVAIETGVPGTVSSAPNTLVANLINYTNKPVNSGDEVEFKLSVINPPDMAAEAALDTQFMLDTFPPEAELVVGSVVSSQGVVVSGNGMGDTSILVDFDNIADGEIAEVYFRIVANQITEDSFSLQGTVSALGITSFVSDDPRNPDGDDDATPADFVKHEGFIVIPLPNKRAVVIPQ